MVIEVQVKTTMWTLLLASGGALGDSRYGDEPEPVTAYGVNLNIDYDRTVAAYEDIVANGIDLDASSEIRDDSAATFAGTFATSDDQLSYVSGILVSGSGKSYVWAAEIDQPARSISAVVRMLVAAEAISVEDAIERLADRLTIKDADYLFAHGCQVHVDR